MYVGSSPKLSLTVVFFWAQDPPKFNNQPALQLPSLSTPGCRNRVVAEVTGFPTRPRVKEFGWGKRELTYAFEGCGVIGEKLPEIEVEVAGFQVYIPWANAWKRNTNSSSGGGLKSLEPSKWLHDWTTPLIRRAFISAKCAAAKIWATDDAAAGQKCWCNINSLVTAEDGALCTVHEEQHGFHPTDEILIIIKSLSVLVNTLGVRFSGLSFSYIPLCIWLHVSGSRQMMNINTLKRQHFL